MQALPMDDESLEAVEILIPGGDDRCRWWLQDGYIAHTNTGESSYDRFG